MAVSTPAPTDLSPGTWGVLRTGPPCPTPAERHLRALGDALGGLVAVGSGFPRVATARVPVPPEATTADCLAAGIRRVPRTAQLIAWLDGGVPAPDWPAAIAALSAELGSCAAALFAVPVTDAVKLVRDGRIAHGVGRDGLCAPVPPVVIRADVARDVLLARLDGGEDPIVALSAGGVPVRVVVTRRP